MSPSREKPKRREKGRKPLIGPEPSGRSERELERRSLYSRPAFSKRSLLKKESKKPTGDSNKEKMGRNEGNSGKRCGYQRKGGVGRGSEGGGDP